jgi:hypothetical protein
MYPAVQDADNIITALQVEGLTHRPFGPRRLRTVDVRCNDHRPTIVGAMVRPGESGGCYVCEPAFSLPDASAL